ncbi:MAG: hypothetical protein JNL06_17145 [Alphaproteobacteria bacterium]|nr:hypothetical protein [Alphaproteobacteria bacterium]
MVDDIAKLILDPNGPLGMNEGFFQNAVAEFGGFILGALVFSILIPVMIDARQSSKWRPARQNFGQELLLLHVAMGETLLRFVRTPMGPARVRAADAVDNAYRAFPALTGLYGYALTADISREVNDYMRMLRAVRDWTYEAAHPEDVGFLAVERRLKQTREMFSQANREFEDVLDVLRVNGFADVCWKPEMIAELATAYDATHRKK